MDEGQSGIALPFKEETDEKKIKKRWNQFLTSNALVYVILVCMFYALIVGVPSLFYASELNGPPWLVLNLFGPTGVIIILLLVNKPEPKPIKPERFTTGLENAQAVMADVQAWMEAERFTEIHTEQEKEVDILWGQRFSRAKYTLVEYVAVLSYQGAYSEEVEMRILERIFHQALENTNRGPRVNMQIISINCVKKRQSALTKALYQSATGAMDLMLHCGYVEQEKSFRIQAIDKFLLSNQKGLKKLRKRVLAMFEGKLNAVIEIQKEPK